QAQWAGWALIPRRPLSPASSSTTMILRGWVGPGGNPRPPGAPLPSARASLWPALAADIRRPTPRIAARAASAAICPSITLRVRARPGPVSLSMVCLVERRHHVLDARVVLEPVHRQVLAVAGLLEAAVRHLGDQRDVGVDPDAAEVQPARHPHGPAVVGRPHRRRQAVLGPVGPLHGLVLVGEALHGDHRAEDLL